MSLFPAPRREQRPQAVQVVADHVIRRGLDAEVNFDQKRQFLRVRYRIPKPPPLVSLIIPTRDQASLLRTCIQSIRARTSYSNYEILILDNDSSAPDTARLFEELRSDPAIRILSRAGPFNYSALNNWAAGEANGTILGLLNNDIEVLAPDWLDEMVSLASHPELGCVGAMLLYPDGRIQHAGVVLGIGGLADHNDRFGDPRDLGYLNHLASIRNVSAVTAACLLVRKEIFEKVGGMDEQMRVAFNDVDFCLKIRAAGFRNVWTPFAELLHHESATRGRDLTTASARRSAAEMSLMYERWGLELLTDPYYSPHLASDREDNYSIRLQ